MGLRAIDLFGGETRVVRQMTDMIREGLASKTVKELGAMERLVHVAERTLVDVATSNRDVDYVLFETIAPLLKLSIHDVLGAPRFDAGEREVWEKEQQDSPMVVVGLMQGEGRSADVTVPLEMYVTLRAVEELNAIAEGDRSVVPTRP